MAIKDKYVSEFVPLQEIPRLQTLGGFVDLSNDDLFLISKLSAEATVDTPAIALSKSLRYLDLKECLSSDMGIQLMKDDIYQLSVDLLCLSDEVRERYEELINTISSISTFLSTDYTRKITELSDMMESDYAKKYNEIIDIKPGKIITRMSIVDGLLLSSGVRVIDLSDYINLEGASIAAGTVLGTYNRSETVVIELGLKSIEFTLECDCYMDIELSVLENDDCSKPLEVYVYNLDPSSTLDGEISYVTSKIGQFNNPGGFGGVQYYNYYHMGIPLKCKYNGSTAVTKVIVKYADNSEFLYDENNRSSITFTEYRYYATIAESELSNYVHKYDGTKENSLRKLYTFRTTNTGLVYDALTATEDDLILIAGYASNTSPGFIRTGYTSSGVNYKLQANTNGDGYVTVPKATSTAPGTIALSSTTTRSGTTGSFLPLQADSSSKGYVWQPYATTNVYGTVKLLSRNTNIANLYGVVSDNGIAKAQIPTASETQAGVVKIDNRSDIAGRLYVDSTTKMLRCAVKSPKDLADDIYEYIYNRLMEDTRVTFIVK